MVERLHLQVAKKMGLENLSLWQNSISLEASSTKLSVRSAVNYTLTEDKVVLCGEWKFKNISNYLEIRSLYVLKLLYIAD